MKEGWGQAADCDQFSTLWTKKQDIRRLFVTLPNANRIFKILSLADSLVNLQ